MKTWIVAMAMMMGVTMSAQEHGRKHHGEKGPEKEQRDPLTPEQHAELRAKKLTLALDLTDKQQAELQKVFTEQGKDRQKEMEQRKANHEAGKKPTAEEHFAMETKRLDSQIAGQRKIKNILSAEQYAKFEQMKHERHEKITKGLKKFKKNHRR
jgi:periplasmic protein CpxP/Spy